jgi:hypothetical protein
MSEPKNDSNTTTATTGTPAWNSPEFLERRRQAMVAAAEKIGFRGIDEGDPIGPSGHAYAIRKSTWLTSTFRKTHRKHAMDITPQDVIDVMIAAEIKDWVLMGLHGYVGYLPQPRATQDVDVMVSNRSRKKAKEAIAACWPSLVIEQLPQVTRFHDPADVDADGKAKVVLDLMHTWAPFQELILKECVIVDPETRHRLPTVEAALVSKYAAMISPYRSSEKKHQDASDFINMAKANRGSVKIDELRRLANVVWETGADDVQRLFDKALAGGLFEI